MPTMEDVNSLKPSFKYRRIAVYTVSIFCLVFIAVIIGLATWLAIVTKFGIYISILFILTQLLCFATLVSLIGAYVFNARWETDSFFSLIEKIAPDITISNQPPPKKDEYDPLGMGIQQDMRNFGNDEDCDDGPKFGSE